MRQSGIELNVLSRVWILASILLYAGQRDQAARLLSKQRSLTYDSPCSGCQERFSRPAGCRTPKTSFVQLREFGFACKDGRSRLSTWTTGQSAFGIPEVPIPARRSSSSHILWIARWKTTTLVAIRPDATFDLNPLPPFPGQRRMETSTGQPPAAGFMATGPSSKSYREWHADNHVQFFAPWRSLRRRLLAFGRALIQSRW